VACLFADLKRGLKKVKFRDWAAPLIEHQRKRLGRSGVSKLNSKARNALLDANAGDLERRGKTSRARKSKSEIFSNRGLVGPKTQRKRPESSWSSGPAVDARQRPECNLDSTLLKKVSFQEAGRGSALRRRVLAFDCAALVIMLARCEQTARAEQPAGVHYLGPAGSQQQT